MSFKWQQELDQEWKWCHFFRGFDLSVQMLLIILVCCSWISRNSNSQTLSKQLTLIQMWFVQSWKGLEF